jgi:multimeric flavodoxin WrbA
VVSSKYLKGIPLVVTILIVYHSQTGRTKKMAQAVAKGADSIENVRTSLKEARETTLDDLLNSDGVAFGSPEYFGYMAGAIKDLFDRTYYQARGRKEILKKPYVVFISAGNDGLGALRSIERICVGYQLKRIYEPVIARGDIDETILGRCEELGKVIAAGCEAKIY